MEEIKEATVIEKTALIKPKFDEEIKAEIKGISTIEDNIKKVKDYAIQIKEYYTGLIFTEETKAEAENEKADMNKFKKQVSDLRKRVVTDFNEPIRLFEETSKEAEKILAEAYELINTQVKVFDAKELEKIREKVESYFDEYAASKGIDFIKFAQMNLSITKGLLTSTNNLTKKTQDQINEFINQREKDLILIDSLEHKEEILIEYKKTLKAADSINLVMDRHKQLENMKKQEEMKEEQKLTDEAMLNKIESLSAPVEEVKQKEELVTFAFEFTGPMESAKIIVNALRNVECEFRQLKKVEDHYE